VIAEFATEDTDVTLHAMAEENLTLSGRYGSAGACGGLVAGGRTIRNVRSWPILAAAAATRYVCSARRHGGVAVR
jgi:hypothetical protein